MRSYSVELMLVAMLVAAVGFFGYLGYGLIRADAAVEGYSGESALAYAARQMEFGPRPITSDANAELEAWLIGELQAADWRAAVQPYVAQVPVSAVGSDVLSATVSADFYTVEGENIIAVKAPTDVEDPPVGLMVTHFDSRVVSDADPDPALRADLNPGANAGASGTAALLELAHPGCGQHRPSPVPGLCQRRGQPGAGRVGDQPRHRLLPDRPAQRPGGAVRQSALRRGAGPGRRRQSADFRGAHQ
ncbi:MAG: hypothetical protein R2851_04750 [Caldilineaceae bacterium]